MIQICVTLNRETQKCRLSLAVNREGEDDKPDWFNLEIWGKLATVTADYVRKGTLLAVKGSLTIDRWQDNNTKVMRSSPVILVDRLDILSSKRDSYPNDDWDSYIPEPPLGDTSLNGMA